MGGKASSLRNVHPTPSRSARAAASASARAAASASASAASDTWHISALQFAAWHGDADRVAALLRQGASTHGVDKDGWTVAHFAVRGRCARCLTLLLAAGARASAPAGRLQQTPLHFAGMAGDPDCVVALLAAGADLNATDSAGRTALALAQQHLETVQAAEQRAPYQESAAGLGRARAAVRLLQCAASGLPLEQVVARVRADALQGAEGEEEADHWLHNSSTAAPAHCPSLARPSGTTLGVTLAAAQAPASPASGGKLSSRHDKACIQSTDGDGSTGGGGSTHSTGSSMVRSGAAASSSSLCSMQPRTCRVCLEETEQLLALIPCGHRGTCAACTQRLLCWDQGSGRCPLCRTPAAGSLVVFDC